jgi:hypothetical protein
VILSETAGGYLWPLAVISPQTTSTNLIESSIMSSLVSYYVQSSSENSKHCRSEEPMGEPGTSTVVYQSARPFSGQIISISSTIVKHRALYQLTKPPPQLANKHTTTTRTAPPVSNQHPPTNPVASRSKDFRYVRSTSFALYKLMRFSNATRS